MPKTAALTATESAPLDPGHFAFANRGYPAERTIVATRRAFSDLVRRARPDAERRSAIPRVAVLADDTSSVMVATVTTVKRTLGAGIALDPVEMACAETYRQPADRERYLAARILLRHALSKAVGGRIAPNDWRYREGLCGKPMMAAGLPPLQFSISHSGDCVAVGVSMTAPIGIDVECIDPERPQGVIDEVLTDSERDMLQRSPAGERQAAFIQLWTAKEACAKALGLGFSLDFGRIEVRGDPMRVRMLDKPAGEAEPFDLASTTLSRQGRSYALSVARIVVEDA